MVEFKDKSGKRTSRPSMISRGEYPDPLGQVNKFTDAFKQTRALRDYHNNPGTEASETGKAATKAAKSIASEMTDLEITETLTQPQASESSIISFKLELSKKA